MNCTTSTTVAADGLLQASISQANRDPDDIEQIASAIGLIRARQLARADVQQKLGAIFEHGAGEVVDEHHNRNIAARRAD
jgi:hypothetical protein